jgi:RNA polymerase sigma-70 factor (ECF subfamily)
LQRHGRQASLEEIERIYRDRLPDFRRAAAAIIGDRELARDAVQDAFALAVRKRGRFRGQGPLEAWLWRIVINATRSQSRRDRAALPRAPAERANGQPDDGTDHVRAAVALLSERQRLVLFLHYYADLDYATIAGALGISPGTVGATLHSARAAVRRTLEEVVE